MPERLHSENWSRQEVYRQNIVLGLLVGKVICSQCDHKLVPAPSNMLLWDQLVVTRWLNANGDQLTVDLDCRMCGHGGLYEFPDNPLLEFEGDPKVETYSGTFGIFRSE